MKIGFDISQVGANKAGCGYYAWALAQGLVRLCPEERYAFFPSFGDFFLDAGMPAACPIAGPHDYGPRYDTIAGARAFWSEPELQQRLPQLDVVHANNFWCPTGLTQTRLVYTLYDLGFVDHPWWTTEANRFGCFEGVFRASLHADWIVAISAASRDHFLRIFPHFPAERVVVIHPCSRFVEPIGEGVRPGLLGDVEAGRFWLSVGTIEPRKNQARLVEAYAKYLDAHGPRMPLVFAGGKGWLMEEFRQNIDRLGISEHVRFTGYVSDDELVWLYRHCFCNVYPSLFEGFGLPVLEGMQMGAPTITTNSSSIPEVAADAAIMVEPHDADQLARALLRVAGEPGLRERLAAASVARAREFRWEDAVSALRALYDKAVATPKRATGVHRVAA